MSHEYYTVQHPPFFVSDQRALATICYEMKITNIPNIAHETGYKGAQHRAIAAYILSLYTAMSIQQICSILNISYASFHSIVAGLQKKIKSNRYSIVSRELNNIINKL